MKANEIFNIILMMGFYVGVSIAYYINEFQNTALPLW
jgi:hypothetical protein